MSELKRCPFCGGGLTFDDKGCYFHPITGCFLDGIIVESEEGWFERWNTRKPLERIVERLEESLDKTMEENSQEWNSHYRTANIGKCVAFRDAIEIVRECNG